MANPSERRRFWRAVFKSQAMLHDDEGSISADLLDISLNGALLEVPAPWQGRVGDRADLVLSLADDANISMRASVAHVEGQRVGLRCEGIDLDSITHLRRLVELNSGDPALLQRELSTLLQDTDRPTPG